MSPEFWIAFAGVFVLGSAIGSAGTLFAQWIVGKFSRPGNSAHRTLEPAEWRLLRTDIHDLSRHVHNLDARMEFTERLLGGSLSTSAPPQRLEPERPLSAPPEDLPDDPGDEDADEDVGRA